MSNDRRRDGSKPSFSERDKRSRERRDDRSSGPSGGPGDGRSAQSDKAYKAALEKAFATGRIQEMAATLSRGSTISLTLPTTSIATPPAPGAVPAEGPLPIPKKPAVDPAVAEKRELTDKIRSAETSRDTEKAIDRYLAKYESLPRDWDILEKALSHPKSPVVTASLELLATWLEKEKPRRTRSLGMQLAILIDTHIDPAICELAGKVRAAL
jgi:hypothetical protein